jgi:hypothetical protein
MNNLCLERTPAVAEPSRSMFEFGLRSALVRSDAIATGGRCG